MESGLRLRLHCESGAECGTARAAAADRARRRRRRRWNSCVRTNKGQGPGLVNVLVAATYISQSRIALPGISLIACRPRARAGDQSVSGSREPRRTGAHQDLTPSSSLSPLRSVSRYPLARGSIALATYGGCGPAARRWGISMGLGRQRRSTRSWCLGYRGKGRRATRYSTTRRAMGGSSTRTASTTTRCREWRAG